MYQKNQIGGKFCCYFSIFLFYYGE